MAYLNDTYSGGNPNTPPSALMQEEPPLVTRLEQILNHTVRSLRIVDALNNGERPEKDAPPPPVVGVLQLGVECERAAMALENELMVLSKRIGRL